GLVDEWLGLDASLTLSRRGGVWAFPIQTVSQSEGGYEPVHQSTAGLPPWLGEPDAEGRWGGRRGLRLGRSPAGERELAGGAAAAPRQGGKVAWYGMSHSQAKGVAVFGGTFDPVHLGHLILAEQAREQARLDEVWFIPAASPPHKQGQPITPFAQRVEMLS